MKFQFDKNKSTAKWEKHGIDFDQAQALWDDFDLLEIPENVCVTGLKKNKNRPVNRTDKQEVSRLKI